MSNLIWSLAKRFCKNDIQYERRQAVIEQCPKEVKSNKIELEQYINKPVIVISNEIDNYAIGIGSHITKFSPSHTDYRLVIFDYITNQPLTCFGKIYGFSDKLLKLLYDTDMRLVNHLLYKSSITDDVDVQLSNCLSYDEVLTLLIEHGFYGVLNEQNSLCSK